MTDLNTYSDRDLLVALMVKLDHFEKDFGEFKTQMREGLAELRAEVKKELEDLGVRVRALEDRSNTQRGFFAGAEWLRSLLASLPVGVAGWFFGRGA